jgi:hypoxanthine phosphoribosyltransferase
MNKVFISWDEFHKDCDIAASKVLANHKKIDTIVSLSRGGLVPARIMAEHIKPDNFYVMGVSLYDGFERKETVSVYQELPEHMYRRRSDNILIIDDVSDGGATLNFVHSKIKESSPDTLIITTTPYIKTGTTFIPNYYTKEYSTDEWIVFPFEND